MTRPNRPAMCLGGCTLEHIVAQFDPERPMCDVSQWLLSSPFLCRTACLRPLSFPPFVTLPIRFFQGQFNSDCDSRNWGAWLRGTRVRASTSSPPHFIRTLFDYTTLHVSRTTMSQFVALPLHRNMGVFT